MESTPGPNGRERVQINGPPLPLIGRTMEQESLRQELAAAMRGDGQVCLVGGEAGIGKTTLARDLGRTARSLGARVLTGSCYDLRSFPPYGPWLDLFESCRRDATLPQPPAAFAGGQLASITDQSALFADVRRFFTELAAERPAVVILEDLHWADPASLDLLRHIGPHVRHWPVLLLVTYRSDELAPGHPFWQHVPALVREADGRRFDLHRLDAPALRSLVAVRHSLPSEDEDRLLAYLQRHAEGNPFFATEILRTLEEEGLLRPGDDGWTLAELDRIVVPALLRQVIDGRVIRLGETVRVPLSIAAVFGHEVPIDLWAEVADLSTDAILDTVERAVEAHLLEAERDGTRVRFVHALTREALYERILPPRRRIWHRKIAEALMATPQPDPDAVAFHLYQGGDARAVDWLIEAGERAQRAYAWLTAVERFRAATTLLEGVVDQQHTHRRLLIRIFYLLRFAYPADAIEATDEARRLASEAGDRFLIAESRNLRGVLFCYIDRFRAGLAEMDAGIGAIEQMPPEVQQTANTLRDWLSQAYTGRPRSEASDDEAELHRFTAAGIDYRRSYHSWYLASAGHLPAARAFNEWFVDTFTGVLESSDGIRMMTAFARHSQAIAAVAQGRPDEARSSWGVAREEFGEHHVVVAFTLLDELRDSALTFGAADPAARRRLAAEAEAAMSRGVGALRPGVSPRLAWVRCLLADGDWDAASQILDDVPDPGNTYLRRETRYARALLGRHRGEPEVAWAHLLPLFPDGAATPPGDIIHQEGLQLQRLAAALCLDAGNLSDAEAWLTAHDTWLAWNGCALGQAEGALAWGHFHVAAGDVDRARAQLAAALDLAKEPAQPLVLLGAHRLLGELDTRAHRVDDAGTHLGMALSLASACEMPHERALTIVSLAGLRVAQDQADDARGLLDEAGGILATLGVQTPPHGSIHAAHVAGGQPNRFGLTRRELDVLRLVAEGRTNPEIASALFISTETARTHVSNIYRKLEVRTRAEAVDRAHRYGLLAASSRQEA